MADNLGELVAKTYGSLTGADGHASFIREIAQAFRSHLIARQVDTASHDHAPAEHYDNHGKAIPDLAESASKQPYVNPWFESPMAQRLLRDGVAGDEGCVSPARLRQTDFYADILRPFDIFHSFGFVLEQRGTTTSVISVSRSHRMGYYSKEELDLAKQLLPHLRSVCAIQKLINDNRLRHGIQSQRAAWALTASGTICGRSDFAADTASNAYAVVSERGTKLRACNVADRSCFAAAVTAAGAGTPLQLRVALRDQTGTPRCIAHVHHCQNDAFLSWLLTDRPAVLVVLQPLGCDFAGLEETLSRLYGLTPAECRVAAALLHHESAQLVAVELCRSEETIRSQLKSVFAKTKTNSQVSLVKLLCALTLQ